MVLFEMCCKFKTNHERSESILKLRNERLVPKDLKEKCPIECELIILMTEPRHEKRPSATELLRSGHLKSWALDV